MGEPKPQALDIDTLRKSTEASYNRNKYTLLGIFFAGICILTILYQLAPALTEEDQVKLFRFPRKPKDLRIMYEVMNRYTEQQYYWVLTGFCFLYIFLQSFAIPGPVFLSILSGSLFGGVLAFFLVAFCATFGACCCYMLSAVLGKGLILRFFPGMLVRFNNRIIDNMHNLLFYMGFLRITPLVPNWFINIASPMVGVPITTFATATFLGLIPMNLIHINAGITLATMQQFGVSWTSIGGLFVLGFLALIPTLFTKKYKEHN